MPKHKDEINTPEAPDDATDAKAVQKWQVWTQGPKDAKETKRKFKNTTPGQVRDYKHFVSKRRFQKFESVETDEDAAVNSVSGGGVDMAPNASGTKVFMKRRRLDVDGRSKAYRAATKRIKERNAKAQERDAVKKLSQFGVTDNPFQREQKEMDDNKYLETKDGSIEQAAVDSVSTDKPYNPNSDRPTLTLPKNRYLETKEESIEWSVMKALSENGDHPPKGPHQHKLPRQLKDPKKEKMVGTKSGTKVVDRGDPKYKNAPEHESVEVPEASGEIKAKKLRLKRRYKTWDKASKSEPEKGEEGGEKGDVEAGPKEKEKSSVTKSDLDRVSPKELKGKFKDRKDKDIDNDGKVNKLDRFLHKRRKAISKDKANQDEDPVGKVKEGKEQHPGQKKGSAKLKKGWGMTQSGEPYFKPNSNNPTRDKKESKEVDAGERDLGSDGYANYVKTLTPGEKAETDVHSRDARKAEVKQKKEKSVQNHQATRIDDAVRPGMFGSKPGPTGDTDSLASKQKPKPKKEDVNTSMVDAVKEVLGLGNKWPGMEKMPPIDPKTGKMVTGKSKIERLPDKKPRKIK